MVEVTNNTQQPDDDARARELLDYHKKIKRHIDLLSKVANDMDEVDIVYKIWGWVEKAGISEGDSPQKLAELLASFKISLFNHFENEEKHLFPVLDKRGATDFSAKLEREHRAMEKAFKDLDRKITMLQQSPRDKDEKHILEQQIRDTLDRLLKDIQHHALEEEDAFFLMDHNI